MPTKIITVNFDRTSESFDDSVLTKFLLNKHVTTLRPEFFVENGKSYWSFFVEYEVVGANEVSKQSGLNPKQQILYQKLYEWRKQKAMEMKVPVFIISTNKNLNDIAMQMPQTLQALKLIHGFGAKKVNSHGKEIIEIVKPFAEDDKKNHIENKHDHQQNTTQ
jgi:superfamily II DNA helicase RecQ